MDLSLALPTSGSWATPDNVVALAKAADSRGAHGLWTFQRVLYPAAADMPSVYESALDPIVALGFAAGVTTTARLGLAVVNGPFFAPAVLAKQLTTIDILSGGRLDAGIGLGWHPDEYATVGLPMKARGRRFDDWLACLDALLVGGAVEFSGEFYSVPPSLISPVSVQRPRPPIYIGGSSAAAYSRAARYDGWIASSRASLDDIREAIATMRAQGGGGRCVVRGVTVLRDESITGERPLLHGSIAQISSDVSAFAEAGVDELFFDLNFDSAEVGSPRADAGAAMEKAYSVLENCFPA